MCQNVIILTDLHEIDNVQWYPPSCMHASQIWAHNEYVRIFRVNTFMNDLIL